jgi:hypothetical protein
VSTGYRPVGEAARRGGGRRIRLPPPLSPVSLVERYSPTNPHRPAAPRPPPAPSRGGRAVWDDSPGYSARGDERDLGGVFTLTAGEVVSSMALYLRDIAPVGRGSTGRGVEHPPPLPRRVIRKPLSPDHPGPRALTLKRRRSSPAASARAPLQRPEPALKPPRACILCSESHLRCSRLGPVGRRVLQIRFTSRFVS